MADPTAADIATAIADGSILTKWWFYVLWVIVTALGSALGRGEAWKVYIVNAHTLNLAWEDPEFRQVLNEADLLLNDGSGVSLASRMAGKPFPDNLVGTDLVPQLCERALPMGVTISSPSGRFSLTRR